MLLKLREVYFEGEKMLTRERHINPQSIDEMIVHRFGAIVAETGGSKNYTKVTTNKGEVFIIEGLSRDLSSTIVEANKQLLKG